MTETHCTIHDQPHEVTTLITGEYSYCTACSDERIANGLRTVRERMIEMFGFLPKYITIDGVAHGSEGQISEPEAERESA